MAAEDFVGTLSKFDCHLSVISRPYPCQTVAFGTSPETSVVRRHIVRFLNTVLKPFRICLVAPCSDFVTEIFLRVFGLDAPFKPRLLWACDMSSTLGLVR